MARFAVEDEGWSSVQRSPLPHLKRYLAEYDFRYNGRPTLGVEDAERMTKFVQDIVGKRLTYKDSSGVGV
jgi:hypothetical protein